MNAPAGQDLETRALVLAPTSRDAEATRSLLSGIGVASQSCSSLRELCLEGARGAAVVILTEAVFSAESLDPLFQLIERQPPWSDLPLLILTHGGAHSERGILALEQLGNVVLLDQPVRVAMLLSAVRGAIRSRQRQYQLRAEIAAQERARQALRDADRRKDEFLATLGHELRNPLAAICNAAYALEHSPPDDASVPRLQSRIARQAQHLSRLVDDLLDVARITRGKIELRQQTVDLRETAARAVEATEEILIARGHTLKQHIPAQALPVNGDPARLEQILTNLLSNAAKYTEPGGRIELSLSAYTGEAVVKVKDSGTGIAPEMLPHIFDLFTQADRARERSAGGLGIGLSLVRSLVRMHGGTVTAESDGLDRGSAFTVRLPLADGVLPEDEAPTEAASPAAETRVLVVDDNPDSGGSLGDLLEVWGYPYRLAQSGAEALRAVPDFRPTLILLDLHMPGMSGFEVAERLNQDPTRSDYRVVALTGYGQAQDRHRTAAAGFDDHLTKPVNPDVLLALLRDGDS